MMIRLIDYAAAHGKSRQTLTRLAAAGRFETAERRGKIWYINADESYPDDGRVRNGQGRGWRKKVK